MSLFGDLGGGADAVFDDARVQIADTEFDKTKRLAFEKEMLGLYVSDHPLLGAEAALRRHADVTVREMREQKEGEMRRVGGVVTTLVRKYTKRGELMATFTLEDLEASLDVWVFPRTMQEVGHLLADDAIVCVKGRLDLRDDEPKLICMELRRPELILDGAEPPLHVVLPIHALSDDAVLRLKQVLGDHRGEAPVFLHVGTKVIRLAEDFTVDARSGLLGRASGPAGGRMPADQRRHALTPARPTSAFGTLPPKPRNLTDGTGCICEERKAQDMAIDIETKDCTALSDAELAEMADICHDGPAGFDIGLLSKQRDVWVLITQGYQGGRLVGFSFCTLERIGGTPCLLWGLASIKR